jgi:hypothetical protein
MSSCIERRLPIGLFGIIVLGIAVVVRHFLLLKKLEKEAVAVHIIDLDDE